MRIKEIVRYQEENNLMGCISGKKDCPLKIFYLDFALCNLPNIYAELLILKKPLLQDHLIHEICMDRGLEILHWRFMLKVQKRTNDDSMNEVKNGEEVYYKTDCLNVVFLQKIDNKVKYKTITGQIKYQNSMLFRTISKGDEFREYKFDGKDSGIKAKKIEQIANECGFRTNLKDFRDSYILKIYNDDISLVKDFITLFCEHNLPFNFPFS